MNENEMIEYFTDALLSRKEIVVNGMPVMVISHFVDYSPPIELHKFDFSGGCFCGSAEIERHLIAGQ